MLKTALAASLTIASVASVGSMPILRHTVLFNPCQILGILGIHFNPAHSIAVCHSRLSIMSLGRRQRLFISVGVGMVIFVAPASRGLILRSERMR